MPESPRPHFALGPLNPTEAAIVAVCVAPEAEVPTALERLFATAAHDPMALVQARIDVVSILALLAARALRRPEALPPGWASRLRGALALELARARAFDAIVGPVLADPSVQALEPVVTKGAAIAAACYPATFARHTSHLSLVVSGSAAYDDVGRAIRAAGCVPEHDAPSGSRQLYRHTSGMPVFVFGGHYCNRLRDFSYDMLRADAVSGIMAGHTTLIPSPHALWTDLVYSAHVYEGQITVQWVVDAVWLARMKSFDPFDTSALHADSRLTLPYRVYAETVAGFTPGPAMPSAG
jgi:hypothetical protein